MSICKNLEKIWREYQHMYSEILSTKSMRQYTNEAFRVMNRMTYSEYHIKKPEKFYRTYLTNRARWYMDEDNDLR